MLKSITTIGILLCCLPAIASFKDAMDFFKAYKPEVRVTDPYIELHTGPGRGYPIFYVAGQGDKITILKRRTDWFKVRTPRSKEGWVSIKQMSNTLDLDGEAIDFGIFGIDDFEKRRWDVGITTGDFGGAASISGFLGYAFTPNISLQLEGSQILGDFSDGLMGSLNIVMRPFPQWRVSPFFTLGTGIIHIEPHTTIVQAEDRTDEIAHVGGGLDVYLTRRFIFRMEYKRHTVFTSRNDNDEIDQWKAGFSFFL